MTLPLPAPTARDVYAAADRIRTAIHRTPLVTSRSFDERSGLQVFLKAENLQRGGSFKLRGASNFVLSMEPERWARGVVAYSSGNHAQAVAIAARAVGAPATLVMPEDAPRSKVQATRDRGARIVTYDRFRENRETIGKAIAEETGATLIPPYDHPWTVAGQGTTAIEMLDEQPDLDALVVCLGGGGLLSGCALAARAHNPAIRLFGVEPADGNDYFLSLQRGEPVSIPVPTTICDGLRTLRPGDVTLPIIREHVEQVILVSDDEVRATMRFILERLKLVVEPSGAAAAAAVLFRKLPAGLRKVGLTLSGGNMDLEMLQSL